MLLAILYDPRIRHGMSRAEAMPVARDILQQLRPPREPAAQEQRPILPRHVPTDRPI
jgi:hypothetical protein